MFGTLVWCIAVCTWSVSGISVISGISAFWYRPESFYSLYRFVFYCLLFRLVNITPGIMFFLFFFSYVFCSIISMVFFSSKVFFIMLSPNFLSVIAVIYFDISNSSAEIVLKLLSFSISISLLQNFFGVSFSACLGQKKSPRLWQVSRFGEQPYPVFYFYTIQFRFIFSSSYLVQGFGSHSPYKIFLYSLLFSGPSVRRNIFPLQQWWCDVSLKKIG